ncbi:baseplate assembly protein [Bacillus phage 278BB001]|nr:baseplate assembly protein [Bacillus phage 010DV004]QZA69397.1 baseplate assembly protein [Bacillus phage 010DV005]QZA69965.1 baseplate assembly protein [Bacillus phage 043JT007]QZA70324.1 baseplate assembly protein [Bacillus phage 278BB001]
MKFVKHIISYGDTMQSIAQQELGDMTQWVSLVKFNNLKYPYIVDTVEEKMKNPDHLVTIGDTLLIKISDDAQSILINELKRSPEYDQEELYALALGKDLDILPLPRGMGDPGRDSETLEMKGNSRGGIATVRGIENLKQSLYIRLLTPKGSYVGHPNYGSELHKYLGMKNTEENAALIDLEIERTLRTDSRVKKVTLNQHVLTGNSYTVSFSVSTMSLEDAFEFVLSAQNNGPVVLLDNFNDAIM